MSFAVCICSIMGQLRIAIFHPFDPAALRRVLFCLVAAVVQGVNVISQQLTSSGCLLLRGQQHFRALQ